MTQSKVKVKVTSPEIRQFSKAIFFPIYNGGWQMTRPQYLKLVGAGFLCQFLCYVTLKLAVSSSRPSVLYGANLLFIIAPLLIN